MIPLGKIVYKSLYVLMKFPGGDHGLGLPLGGGINYRRKRINET